MTKVYVCLPQLFKVHPCNSTFFLLWVASGPTVKVKFELHKECHYGQQFNVVGSDPQLGDWEPSAALPLNWTEGHVWTTEVVSCDCHSFEIYVVDTENLLHSLSGDQSPPLYQSSSWELKCAILVSLIPGVGMLIQSSSYWELDQTSSPQ